MYICSNRKCNKKIESLDSKFTRCPHCGHRVLYKVRQPIAREVSTD
ncbi:MAG: DNA-directed RNA polymerase subunit P [Candidatus Micrarchaeota archaeon]|nr:DNA-directed RNA polymerase subunit P [Candidatus Micrarchaeota archaeon]